MFIAIVLTAFLARVKPVSTIAKPTCMNITRNPASSTQSRFSATSGAMAVGCSGMAASPGQRAGAAEGGSAWRLLR